MFFVMNELASCGKCPIKSDNGGRFCLKPSHGMLSEPANSSEAFLAKTQAQKIVPT